MPNSKIPPETYIHSKVGLLLAATKETSHHKEQRGISEGTGETRNRMWVDVRYWRRFKNAGVCFGLSYCQKVGALLYLGILIIFI